eukprot:362816-Chlamydomonas_euryale.AAC.1
MHANIEGFVARVTSMQGEMRSTTCVCVGGGRIAGAAAGQVCRVSGRCARPGSQFLASPSTHAHHPTQTNKLTGGVVRRLDERAPIRHDHDEEEQHQVDNGGGDDPRMDLPVSTPTGTSTRQQARMVVGGDTL